MKCSESEQNPLCMGLRLCFRYKRPTVVAINHASCAEIRQTPCACFLQAAVQPPISPLLVPLAPLKCPPHTVLLSNSWRTPASSWNSCESGAASSTETGKMGKGGFDIRLSKRRYVALKLLLATVASATIGFIFRMSCLCKRGNDERHQ